MTNETADSQTQRQPTDQPTARSRSAHRITGIPASPANPVGLMRKTDNGRGSAAGSGGRQPQGAPLPDLALYERLINDGIVAADGRGGAVDDLTARRLALWLAARPQEPEFAHNLGRFAGNGMISPTLKMQLRWRARSATYPDRPQVARMLDYCIDRGTDLGPISRDFGASCDQIDHADTMLARLHDRAREGLALPRQTWPETDGPDIIALAQRNPDTQTVTLILDTTTANSVLFAIAAHADEREAHIREVQRYGETLPEDSYGRRNRQAIAATPRT
jgi:hypothetical protein